MDPTVKDRFFDDVKDHVIRWAIRVWDDVAALPTVREAT